MRKIVFVDNTFEEFTDWASIDKVCFKRLIRLIEESRNKPFEGIGKPEPLKGNLSGKWSKELMKNTV